MNRAAIAFLIIALAACSIRPKQWVGAGLTVATLPVNVLIDDQHSQDMQIIRAGTTFALLAAAITMFELDARRDRTDERVTLIYYGNEANPLQVGHYIQETCSPNVMLCMGPYQVYAVQAVKRLAGKRPRYLVSAVVVPHIPIGTNLFTVHPMIAHGPMEAGAVDDAESTVDDASCPLGCADSRNTALVPEN